MTLPTSITLDLAGIRHLLKESERDFVALSREEADRIIAIPDLALRLKAYMGLREVWARGGDRLLPEDESRVQASLAAQGAAELDRSVPRPPAPGMPLTPLALLAWCAQWRVMLTESALSRSVALGRPLALAVLEALVSAQDDVPETEQLPEIGVLRLLDTLARELREGLEARLLLRDEPLSGHVGNLAGLLRSIVAAKARREIPVPSVPKVPPLRSSIGDILAWFEALLAFEEAVGARALVQAGVVVEPADAAAQFRAAARQGADDIGGHAAGQIASWRRADRAHRAAALALRGGWLARDRLVVLPSFEVDELERWFHAFATPPQPRPTAPAFATPAAVQQHWGERRQFALQRIALTLLADGAAANLEAAERQAGALAASGSPAFAAEVAEIAQAGRIIELCDALLARGASVAPLRDATDAEAVLTAWGVAAAGLRQAALPPVQLRHIAPAPLVAPLPPALPVAVVPSPPAPPASAPPPAEPAPPRPAAATLAATPPAAPPPVAERRRVLQQAAAMLDQASFAATATLVVGGSALIYQSVMVGLAGIQGGVGGAVSELVLRTSSVDDLMWLAAGSVLLLAVLVLAADIARAPALLRGRGWRFATVLRLILAGGLVAGSTLLEQPRRYIFLSAGIPAWPERVVDRGGVPTSTFNTAEGLWLTRRVVEPMQAEDAPAVGPGQPPLVLLREVGFFGGLRSWWLANAPDAAALAGRPAEAFSSAPSVVSRRSPSP